MTIYTNSGTSIRLIGDEQKIVWIFVTEIETRLESAPFQHHPLGDVRNSRAVDSIGEEKPMGHQFTYAWWNCHECLLTNEDAEPTWVVRADMAAYAIAQLCSTDAGAPSGRCCALALARPGIRLCRALSPTFPAASQRV
jgi:hypothetical protein